MITMLYVSQDVAMQNMLKKADIETMSYFDCRHIHCKIKGIEINIFKKHFTMYDTKSQ